MKSLKQLFGFILPLTTMLLAFTLFLTTNNMVKNYEKKIADDYSIVIVTNLPFDRSNVTNIDIKEVISIKKDEIINNIHTKLSDSSIKILKQKLPFFYKIQLNKFPTSSEIKFIKKELKSVKNIRKVEIFSKNHNKIYLLLLLINKIMIITFCIILIFSTIILSKQITIWFYEQQEKIKIFQLHGASIFFSAASVIKYAIYGALISSILVSAAFVFASLNLHMIIPIELNTIIYKITNIEQEILKIFALSLGISIITILGVLFKYKLKNA